MKGKTMYDELVKELRNMFKAYKATDNENCHHAKTILKAADAIEELDMIADNLNYLYKTKVPKWIPVTEKNYPKPYEPVMVVYIGWNDTLPHRDCTAYWSEDEGLWRWAETNDRVKVSVTHYMSLPPLPETPKEETK